jgi:type II secretory pathway pseudopilin PulG
MKALQRKSGFTLIELVLIISLIGVLAVVAVPRISNSQTEQLFFGEEVYTALRYARKVAMNSQCSVAVLLSGTSIALKREKDCDAGGGFTEKIFEPLSRSDQYELTIPDKVMIERTPDENFYFDSRGKVRSVDDSTVNDVVLEVNGEKIYLFGETGVITK